MRRQLHNLYTIALYVRLSAEDSRVGNMSIINQLKALHHYVESSDAWSNAEILEFVDNGYSGTNFERPAIQELLDKVQQSQINCIIVKDFSRLGRNSVEVRYLMERVFPVYGIRFISVNDGFDSAHAGDDAGNIDIAFKHLISEFYSRDLSVKYKSAKYAKMKAGEYQSVICPYGYQKGMDGRMEPDEETAPTVRMIFEMVAQGCTIQMVIKTLFEKGILTPGEYKASKGKHYHDVSRCDHIWSRSAVLRILRDERYIGTYVVRKQEVTEVGSTHLRMRNESEWFKIPNHHTAIISKDLFDEVQKNIRHFSSKKKNKSCYALYRKVFCGNCLHALTRKRIKQPIFACLHTIVDTTSPCHGLCVREKDLEASIYEILFNQAQEILAVNTSNEYDIQLQLRKLEKCEKNISDIEQKKRRLYESWLIQNISKESYITEKAGLDEELERLTVLRASLATNITQSQHALRQQQKNKKLAQQVIEKESLTMDIIDMLVEKIYVYPNYQVEVSWKTNDFCIK